MNVFLDTNIFVYAHDDSDTKKTSQARKLILSVLKAKNGYISTQVLQEFLNVVLTKLDKPLSTKDVTEIMDELFLPMLAHSPDEPFYKRVLKTYQRYSLSFYDSLIVQAANDLNCKILYSEDMQDGVIYGGVKIINPFK